MAGMSAFFGALTLIAAVLWVVYGDRVYFDAIMTGLAGCFSF